MAYCEINDLLTWVEEDALLQMVSLNEEAALTDSDVIAKLNRLISAAGSTIDSYLIGRYGEQVRTATTAAPALREKCAQLAVYYLYLRRRAVDDDWTANYESIIAWLEAARNGKLEIASNEEGAAVEESAAFYVTDAQKAQDTDLNVNDRRYYRPSKQSLLFGLPERS